MYLDRGCCRPNDAPAEFSPRPLLSLVPSLIECHSTDSRQDINTIRLAPELNDVINLQEIFPFDAGVCKSEGFNNRHQIACVFVISTNKDVEITCVTWSPMKSERPGADDYVLNKIRVQ